MKNTMTHELTFSEKEEKAQAFNLDSYIPYNILYTELLMYRSGRKDIEASLESSEVLSQGEIRVLIFVYGGKARSPSDFSEYLSMDKALVTRNINALNKKGLITISQDEVDKRRKVITITEQGNKAAIEVTYTMGMFNDHCDGAITTAEKKSLLKILAKLNEACHQWKQR